MQIAAAVVLDGLGAFELGFLGEKGGGGDRIYIGAEGEHESRHLRADLEEGDRRRFGTIWAGG